MKDRRNINIKYKWDLNKLFNSKSSFDKEKKYLEAKILEIKKYENKSLNIKKTYNDLLIDLEELNKRLERFFAFARLKKDEDLSNSEGEYYYKEALSLMSNNLPMLSFITPKLLKVPKSNALSFVKNGKLSHYKYEVEKSYRFKDNTLKEIEENLYSKLSSHLDIKSNIFDILTDADFKFDDIKDEKGKKVSLTNETYSMYLNSQNQRVRKEAYESLYKTYGDFKNTLTEIFTSFVNMHSTVSEIRKYGSSLKRGLKGDNVGTSVVLNLIKEVNNNLNILKKYLKVKASFLKLKNLNMYDLYAPLVNLNKNYSFENAVELVLKSLSPLGENYIKIFKEGIKNRWIDVYETKNKASGAYSYGTFGAMPYVLLNFTNKIRDVFTLTHEMGHSIHSFLTNKKQPYIYAGHSIFTAEVASTVNEVLLSKYLIKNAETKNEKIFFLSQSLEGFRTTLIRQVMFSEFEVEVFKLADNKKPLIKDNLIKMYGDLNKKYFSPAAKVDENICIEFLRIPHFYRPFYVYKYATGYALALYIAKNLIEGEEKNDFSFREKYIKFLSSGQSDDPIELIKILGVDMNKPLIIKEAFKIFEGEINELKGLS